ncbi:FMN-binding protein [candidate division KSB1 bacterium]
MAQLNRINTIKNLAVVLILIVSFFIGKSRTEFDLIPHLSEVFPDAATFEQTDGIYSAFSEKNELLGWIGTGSASGYGGPLLVITGIDTAGTILGSKVVEHKETPIFIRIARVADYLKSLAGTSFREAEFDYDAVVSVSGATKTANAIEKSIKMSVTNVTGGIFNSPLPIEQKPIEFGLKEIAVVLLFVFGIAAYRAKKPLSRRLRWASQIAGLAILGFWENSPVTLTKLTVFLSGYFPDLHSGIFWYLLIGSFVLTILLLGESTYCTHMCPFGALQRCVGVIGGAKLKLPGWAVRLSGHIRNTIVVTALAAALITVQPGSISYEPFAAVFALQGTLLQWVLLMIVLVLSLLYKNPWCYFLCPMRSFEKALRKIRFSVLQVIRR